MNPGRRDFLTGLGSAIVSGAVGYGGYVWVKGRNCRRSSQSPVSPPKVERQRAWVRAALGEQISASWLDKRDQLSRPLFDLDRGESFGPLRQRLAQLHEPEAELILEVRREGARPHLARVWIELDHGPVPKLYEEDRQRFVEDARLDPMPRRYGPTIVRLSTTDTLVERPEHTQKLAALAGAETRSGDWDSAMWGLANRGGVARLHGRRSCLFVDDDLRWEQVVSAIEAMAPVRCQPHKPRPRSCAGPWVTLFVGGTSTPPATIG